MKDFNLLQKQREKYEEVQLALLLFDTCIIRTSAGNDGNDDEYWDDENTQNKNNQIGGF